MENETPDFRVNDKVYCLATGNGKIDEIDLDEEYPIKVNFGYDDTGDLKKDEYTIYGQMYNKDDNPQQPRTLFHGHNLGVIVEDKKPKRTKTVWVNLYDCKCNYINCYYHNSRSEADERGAINRIDCVKLEIPI